MTSVVSQKREKLDALLDDAEKSISEGRVPLQMFSNPDVFELETEKLWSRVWTFIGHESEIPNPGDYVRRTVATSPLFFVRSRATGEVNGCAFPGEGAGQRPADRPPAAVDHSVLSLEQHQTSCALGVAGLIIYVSARTSRSWSAASNAMTVAIAAPTMAAMLRPRVKASRAT